MNKEERKLLIKDIRRVRSLIEQGRGQHVCTTAYNASSWKNTERIRDMVRLHIGGAYTMADFLEEKFSEFPTFAVTKSYRIAMLNNMIKMVESGEYNG